MPPSVAKAPEPIADLVEAVAASTGVYDRPPSPGGPGRRRTDVALIALVFLLVGGGGATTLGGLLGGTDAKAALERTTEALDRTTALEGELRDTRADLELRVVALTDKVTLNTGRVHEVETNSARMLRQQARVLAWLVEASQRQSAALAAVAKASGVDVDLSTPALLPEVGQ